MTLCIIIESKESPTPPPKKKCDKNASVHNMKIVLMCKGVRLIKYMYMYSVNH